jgi:3-hydroxyisobutyrate dehydrogenase
MALSESVAVLGTGIMGSGLARRLHERGFDVRAWDRSAEKAGPLGEAGMIVAASVVEAVRDVDFVITMLSDGPAVESVMVAPGGGLAAVRSGGVWLQMSTIGVAATERLATRAAARGVAFVDAPVLGSGQPAQEGKLVVLASGPPELQARCRVVFDAIGTRTLWLGPAGTGSRLKLLVNGWLMTLLAALADGVRLSKALGVDPRVFVDTLAGRLLPPFAGGKAEMMLEGAFPPAFPLRLAHKDLLLLLEAIGAAGADPGLARAVEARFAVAEARGLGDADVAAVGAANL